MDDNQTKDNTPIIRRLYERVFPTVADFFGMLAQQSANAAETTRLLVEFMETADPTVSQQVRADEHEADRVKAFEYLANDLDMTRAIANRMGIV
jgi:hypothetical protein